MSEGEKIFLQSAKMLETDYDAAQHLEPLLGGRIAAREQTRELIGYLFARTKCII